RCWCRRAGVDALASSTQDLVDGRPSTANDLLSALVVLEARVGLVAAGTDESGVTELREVVAHVVIALSERRRELAHAVRPGAEHLQDRRANRWVWRNGMLEHVALWL